MASTTGLITRTARPSGLRRTSFTMAILLLVQYGLGIGVNLFVTLPRQDHGAGLGSAIIRAISDGPLAVALHASLGLALIVVGLAIAIQAAAARLSRILGLAVLGLLALAGAAYNGSRFVSTGQNGASFGMALAWAVALLCYLCILYLVTSARPHRQ